MQDVNAITVKYNNVFYLKCKCSQKKTQIYVPNVPLIGFPLTFSHLFSPHKPVFFFFLCVNGNTRMDGF